MFVWPAVPVDSLKTSSPEWEISRHHKAALRHESHHVDGLLLRATCGPSVSGKCTVEIIACSIET
jgi:hypothetical protein